MVRAGLSDRSKNRRSRLCQVTVKVNFIVWIVEFVGCMTMWLDFMVVGNRSNAMTGLLKILTMATYFVVLPSTFLVNCSTGINTIVDNSWMDAIGRIFHPIKEKPKDQKKDSKVDVGVNTRTTIKSSPISVISDSVHDNPMDESMIHLRMKSSMALERDIMMASSCTSQMRHVSRKAWTANPN